MAVFKMLCFYGVVCALFLIGMFLFTEYAANKVFPEDNAFHGDSYSSESLAMKNIAAKCGILGSDPLWTTAMNKISSCIDQPAMVTINGSVYSIPRDGRTYDFKTLKGR